MMCNLFSNLLFEKEGVNYRSFKSKESFYLVFDIFTHPLLDKQSAPILKEYINKYAGIQNLVLDCVERLLKVTKVNEEIKDPWDDICLKGLWCFFAIFSSGDVLRSVQVLFCAS